MSAFNPAPVEAGLPMQDSGAPLWYGGVERPTFIDVNGVALQQKVRLPRKQLNALAICLCFCLPVALFASIFAALSFSWHHDRAPVSHAIALTGLAIVITGYIAARTAWNRRQKAKGEHLTWRYFLLLSFAFAWILSVCLGNNNYFTNLKPYYDLMQFNVYTNVQPALMRGVQVLDAGRIVFVKDAGLDVGKAISFKSGDTYCAAPVVSSNKTAPAANYMSYDFWAVGKNCCGTSTAIDFRCFEGHPTGGLRLMSDADRPFYRLAVQEAESLYGIKAVYPLFFELVQDPIGYHKSMRDAGIQYFQYGISAFVAVQALLVTMTTLAFSRLGLS